jgi:hypothetical protein
MLAEIWSKGRISGYRGRHSDGDAQWSVPVDLHRLSDGSINYELFEMRARQLRAAFLATTLAAGARGLSRALKAAAVMIQQLFNGSSAAVPQRR